MAYVVYIHFDEAELAERLESLADRGLETVGHASTTATIDLKSRLPDALIVSLDRLPSHGRAYAEWLWEAKKRRSIPILFVGGQPEKVDRARTQFPGAVFCSQQELPEQLGSALAANQET